MNMAGQALPFAAGALSLPWLAHKVGVHEFGLLLLVLSFFAYFSIFDFGFSKAVTRAVADQKAFANAGDGTGTIKTALAAQACLSLVAVVVIYVVTPTAVEAGLKLEGPYATTATAAFRIAGLSIPAVLLGSTFRAVLEGKQRFEYVNLVRAPSNTLLFVAPVIAFQLQGSLLLAIWLLVGLKWLTFIAFYLGATLSVRAAKPVRPSFEELKQLFQFGGWISVSNALNPVLVYVDRFVVASITGLAAAGFYSVAHELVTRLSIVPVSVASALFPASASARGAQRQHLVGHAMKSLALVSFLLVLPLFFGASALLHMWMGAEYAVNAGNALRILLLGFLINSIAHVPYTLLQSAGRPDVTARIHIAEAILYVPGAAALTASWGIEGAALAWSARVTFDALALFIAARKLGLLTQLPSSFSMTAGHGAVAVGGLAMMAAAAQWLPPMAGLIVIGAATAGVGLGIWRFFLSKHERSEFLHAFRREEPVGTEE